MEDAIAREGTLARCNQDRDATLNDIECANARRAAAALAVREERERRAQLALESQRKLLALRARAAMEQQAAAQAAAAKRAAEEAAYEARWRDSTKHPDASGAALPGDGAAPVAGESPADASAFGSPLGVPLPSITASRSPSAFDQPSASQHPDASGAALPGDSAAPVAGEPPADAPAFGSPLGAPLPSIIASHAPSALDLPPASEPASVDQAPVAPVPDAPSNGADTPAAQASTNDLPTETLTGAATLAEPPPAAAPAPSAEPQPQPAPSAIPRPFQQSDEDPAATR